MFNLLIKSVENNHHRFVTTACSRQSSFSADDERDESDYGKGKNILGKSTSRNIPFRHQRHVDDPSLELPRHYMMKLQTMQSTDITSPTSEYGDITSTKPVQAEDGINNKTEVCA